MNIVFISGAQDEVPTETLALISKMRGEVVIAEKTKSPVDKTEEKKKTRDNFLFCNEEDGI